MSSAPRILRRDELDRLRRADSILHDAETARRQSEEEGARDRADLLAKAREKALREAARSASRVLAEAEAAAQARLTSLEPELARLVAMTVRRILGEFEPEEASYRAALTALQQLRDHRRGRIFAATDTVAPVERAVDALENTSREGPEIIGIHADPALDPGRAVLTSDRGSVEIGLPQLTEQALKAWAGQDKP